MIIKRNSMKQIVDHLKKYIHEERSSHKLALSFCMGNYIAFSPFLALHTVMVFAAVWLWELNFPITLAVAYGVNNPWTAVPIYLTDYVFGYWFLHKVMHINTIAYNPQWMSYIHYFFEQKLGLIKPCLWSFVIGGNLLGIIISVILYPFMRRFFARLILSTHGAM